MNNETRFDMCFSHMGGKILHGLVGGYGSYGEGGG